MQTSSPRNDQQTAIHCSTNYSHREPPPYPGLARPLYQPGLRQSYSSSETSTDLSLSSCENLSSTVRQDPQGEETSVTATSPLEPPRERGSDCGGGYRGLASAHLGRAQPGVEVKSTNSSTFYVTGNMPPPTTTVCSGDHGYNLVNSSHGNHVGNHGNLKFGGNLNNNNNNNNNNDVCGGGKSRGGSISQTYIEGQSPASSRMSQAKTLMSQYQSDAMRSLCQQVCSSQNLYPGSLTASPNPGSKGLSMSKPSSAQPKYNMQQATQTMMHVPNGKEMTNKAFNDSDSSHSLSQLMSALSRHSANQSSMPPLSRERQRPSTAPSMRHLPTVPPPQYPGYQELRQSPDLERLSLRRSQPDLTRLTELSIANQQPQDTVLPPGDQQQEMKATRPSELGINLESRLLDQVPRFTNQNEIISNAPRMTSATMSYPYQYQMAPPSLSSSSSASSLMQQQIAQLQGALQGRDSTMAAMTPLANTSPILQSDPLMAPLLGSSSSSPDKRQPGSQSPNIGKFSDLDYAALASSNLVDPASLVARSQLVDHAAIATRATQMVERLSEENRSLRQELEGYYKKVYRLQKLELEIQKVHENYETLVKHSHKQQSIEKLIRFKLEAEIKKLRDTNKELKDQLDKALRQLQHKEVYALLDSDIKKELLGKDSLITKLLSQNQDLTLAKEQLEMDCMTQKSAMHDQSVHIRLLDSALSSARSDILKYEEQLHKRKSDDEKVSELQRALSQLQSAVEKREAIEQKLRQKLEEEVQYLRNQQQQSGLNKMADADEGISSDSESPTSLQSLARQMTEKDHRILALEAEVAKVKVILLALWKQKYLEETALRQFAVDAACVPKDARIASLEQSSLATEKLMADARHDCYRQKDEVQTANHRCAELTAKLKTTQAQLAEKDAMIRVLQRHIQTSRTSSITSILCSPLHSPRPSHIHTSSPLPSPLASPLVSHNASSTPSGASSRQNSQLETSGHFSSGSSSTGENSTGGKDREGKSPIHSKSNSTGSAVSNISSSSKDPQLQQLHQKLAAQAALYGSVPPGSDQLKKYLWQV